LGSVNILGYRSDLIELQHKYLMFIELWGYCHCNIGARTGRWSSISNRTTCWEASTNC